MAGSVLVRTFILATVDVGTAAVAELERFDEATLTTVIGVPVLTSSYTSDALFLF